VDAELLQLVDLPRVRERLVHLHEPPILLKRFLVGLHSVHRLESGIRAWLLPLVRLLLRGGLGWGHHRLQEGILGLGPRVHRLSTVYEGKPVRCVVLLFYLLILLAP